MAKPILLTIDDDESVLRGIERDLRKQYGEKYRVMRAISGAAGLDLLNKVQARNETVALLLVDHRMPQMNGVEFLASAMKLYPDSKRVLLTAYAETDAAIRAINEVHLHHYLMKPWDPPETQLYPVLNDLLDDWAAGYRPEFEGIRVLGTRWAPGCFKIRDFLARNQVPYQWLDLESRASDPAVRRILEGVAPEDLQLPLILFPDGERMGDPSPAMLAERLGLQTQAVREFYDLAIVGGGPAGLAAAVYGASEGLRTVMIEREAPGGQAGLSSRIENYLGFPSGLSGSDLTRRAVAQAKRFGVEILSPQEATGLRMEGPYRHLRLSEGKEIASYCVLLATGVQWRRLDVPGMDRLQGAGVYYGSGATEALACKGEDVYIVGGANSAGQAAMYMSLFARRVVMLVRGDSLAASMSQYLIDQIASTSNIEVLTGTQIVEVHGEDRLEEISISCTATGSTEKVAASAVFIFIGAQPGTEWLEGVVARDKHGFILTGPDLLDAGKRPKGWMLDRDPGLLETSIPGVFCVGDVRHGAVRRVASGVGEGSIAVQFVHHYLSTVGATR